MGIMKPSMPIQVSNTTLNDSLITRHQSPAQTINPVNTNFTINYDITGDNKVLDAKMTTDKNTATVVLSLDALSNGTLTVIVPKILDDMMRNQSAQLVVLLDGQEIHYDETKNKTHNVIIPFYHGSKQVIIATIVIT